MRAGRVSTEARYCQNRSVLISASPQLYSTHSVYRAWVGGGQTKWVHSAADYQAPFSSLPAPKAEALPCTSHSPAC